MFPIELLPGLRSGNSIRYLQEKQSIISTVHKSSEIDIPEIQTDYIPPVIPVRSGPV
jgi:hypothetical protein